MLDVVTSLSTDSSRLVTETLMDTTHLDPTEHGLGPGRIGREYTRTACWF
jgi:hypothetical protein